MRRFTWALGSGAQNSGLGVNGLGFRVGFRV